jgi:hypothetical protein
MLYEKLKKAWDQADVDAYKALHQEDFTFTFHSTGRVNTRDDMTDQGMKGMMMSVRNTHQRCIYENDDILVEHAFSEFPSGDKEAVMMVSLKKDGLIWRTETGATPIK